MSFWENMNNLMRKVLILLAVAFICPALYAANEELKNLSQDDFKRLRADGWKVIGNNVILEGNVYLPLGNSEVFADKVIINLSSRDFEAAGNVRLYRWMDISGTATLERIAQLEKSAPGITRPISFRSQRFNQDQSPGAILLEMGSAGNTQQEALLAAEITANAILALSN